MQSTVNRKGGGNRKDSENRKGLHVAVIMDGNGRWATRRGLPRSAGHRAGVLTVRRVVEAAPDLGVATLTLFAFSSDNWRRPSEEVSALMSLLKRYLQAELARLVDSGTRLTVIGRRDRLPDGLGDEIATAERASASGERLDLRIAIDYSSRDAIAGAAARWLAEQSVFRRSGLPVRRRKRENSTSSPSRDVFERLLALQGGDAGADVDLLIRSGGEKRLSDFLLWESAYAELCFVDTLWPDFGADDLRAAIDDFHGRERRFGGLRDPLVAAE
jgi:undecaprenyl diphosphate synthase